MKIRVRTFKYATDLEEFLNGIDVDNQLVEITESGYAIGYTSYHNYTVVYKSRW